ncbi:hypothetical protein BH10PSE19_BH10PSE19_02360 [soil metagenome]
MWMNFLTGQIPSSPREITVEEFLAEKKQIVKDALAECQQAWTNIATYKKHLAAPHCANREFLQQEINRLTTLYNTDKIAQDVMQIRSSIAHIEELRTL